MYEYINRSIYRDDMSINQYVSIYQNMKTNCRHVGDDANTSANPPSQGSHSTSMHHQAVTVDEGSPWSHPSCSAYRPFSCLKAKWRQAEYPELRSCPIHHSLDVLSVIVALNKYVQSLCPIDTPIHQYTSTSIH